MQRVLLYFVSWPVYLYDLLSASKKPRQASVMEIVPNVHSESLDDNLTAVDSNFDKMYYYGRIFHGWGLKSSFARVRLIQALRERIKM